jgi:predicted CopG family antitoxin
MKKFEDLNPGKVDWYGYNLIGKTLDGSERLADLAAEVVLEIMRDYHKSEKEGRDQIDVFGIINNLREFAKTEEEYSYLLLKLGESKQDIGLYMMMFSNMEEGEIKGIVKHKFMTEEAQDAAKEAETEKVA